MPRRVISWVWDTNHDDQVPTAIHSVLVSAMIIAVPFAAAAVLSTIGIIALLAALTDGNLTSLLTYSKVYVMGAEVEIEEKV